MDGMDPWIRLDFSIGSKSKNDEEASETNEEEDDGTLIMTTTTTGSCRTTTGAGLRFRIWLRTR